MNQIYRIIIWICSKFTREDIIKIIEELTEIVENRNPNIKPKDDFKQKHPHYREFYVDPLSPLTSPPQPSQQTPLLDYKQLLDQYEKEHDKKLKPIQRRGNSSVPKHIYCQHCGAPAHFLYFNDGKKKSQIRCKVCHNLSQVEKRHRNAPHAKYFCPYCGYSLYRWKHTKFSTVYKCPNDNCHAYINALNKLNSDEKQLRNKKPSQFKLRYQYREFHFSHTQLIPDAPSKPKVDLARIYSPDNVVGLALTFHISYGISARKTALILKQVFGIKLSYQTICNYCEAAAYYCHLFNLKHKGDVSDTIAGDETYIKIQGKNAFAFLSVSADDHKIASYHISHNRDTLPAAITINESIRTAKPEQIIQFVSDANPSYAAAVHFINSSKDGTPLEHKKVIGLQNLDEESTTYRKFKQIIERLNRTYKYHTRSANGFKNSNGALSLTTLFVTHYNFLRPHMSLNYKVPVNLPQLNDIPTIQGKWCRIIDIAMNTA